MTLSRGGWGSAGIFSSWGCIFRKRQKKVDRVWINFERTAELLRVKDPKRVIKVGNPLRKDFGAISKKDARRRLGISDSQTLVLSFGGSLGAERVNASVLEVMDHLTARDGEVVHIHAAGKRGYDATLSAFCQKGLHETGNCSIVDYIYDMPLRMAAADLVVCRAGAMTLSELALMKKAAVLIPSPNVTDNHQCVNAKTLADRDAAIMVEEKDLEKGTLTDAVASILKDTKKRTALEDAISAFADRDANHRIWQDILELTNR